MENADNETWYELEGYEGKYLITRTGRVKRPTWPSAHSRGKIMVGGNELKAKYFPNGYLHYHLRWNGKSEGRMVHRLIAKMFIPNPENKPQV